MSHRGDSHGTHTHHVAHTCGITTPYVLHLTPPVSGACVTHAPTCPHSTHTPPPHACTLAHHHMSIPCARISCAGHARNAVEATHVHVRMGCINAHTRNRAHTHTRTHHAHTHHVHNTHTYIHANPRTHTPPTPATFKIQERDERDECDAPWASWARSARSAR